MFRYLLCAMLLLVTACSQTLSGNGRRGVVVLDIGHCLSSPGAKTPSPIGGKSIEECSFWYQYASQVKKVVESAGFTCVITNRGNAPTHEPLASYARQARVVHLQRPDSNGQRYPSHYHPDRVASGIISADYAIYRRAACAVFLHHNSAGRGWKSGASPSIIICNKYNGLPLAESLCHALNTEILNHVMPNGGRTCRPLVRSVDADRSAGWMNACDDSGIPAAVVEAAFLNNRDHAAYLAQDANARRYAQAIGHGIVRFLRQYGSAPRHYRANENTPDEGSFGFARESRRLVVPGAKRLLH